MNGTRTMETTRTSQKTLEERAKILTNGYVVKPNQLRNAGIQFELLDGLKDSQGRNYAVTNQRLSQGFKGSYERVDFERPFVEILYKGEKYKIVASNSDIKNAYDEARSIASSVDGEYANLEGLYKRQIKKVLEDKVKENKPQIIEKIKEKTNPTKAMEIKDRKGVVYGKIDTKIELKYLGKTHAYELNDEDKQRIKDDIKNEHFGAFDESGKRKVVERVLERFILEKEKVLRKRAGVALEKDGKPKSQQRRDPNTERVKKRIQEKTEQQSLTQKVAGGLKKFFGFGK